MIGGSQKTRTILSEEEINKTKILLLQYFKDNNYITNQKLRKLSGINYDQAIYFFRQMVNQNIINRLGITSTTHYTLKVERLKKQK